MYHQTGSLLATPDSDYIFSQTYFMGDSARKVVQGCANHDSVKIPTVE